MATFKHHHALHVAQAALVLAGSCLAASAREARTDIAVSATVSAMARIESQSQPTEVQVSAADLQRGYIEVTEPTALVIRSNSPDGFVLDFVAVTPMLASAVVHGLASEQSMGAAGGAIVQRWQNAHSASLSLQFRFVFAPGLAAGRYPWPLRVGVRPLDESSR